MQTRVTVLIKCFLLIPFAVLELCSEQENADRRTDVRTYGRTEKAATIIMLSIWEAKKLKQIHVHIKHHDLDSGVCDGRSNVFSGIPDYSTALSDTGHSVLSHHLLNRTVDMMHLGTSLPHYLSICLLIYLIEYKILFFTFIVSNVLYRCWAEK